MKDEWDCVVLCLEKRRFLVDNSYFVLISRLLTLLVKYSWPCAWWSR